MRVAVDITILGDELGDVRPTPDRMVVRTEAYLGIGCLLQGLIQVV